MSLIPLCNKNLVHWLKVERPLGSGLSTTIWLCVCFSWYQRGKCWGGSVTAYTVHYGTDEQWDSETTYVKPKQLLKLGRTLKTCPVCVLLFYSFYSTSYVTCTENMLGTCNVHFEHLACLLLSSAQKYLRTLCLPFDNLKKLVFYWTVQRWRQMFRLLGCVSCWVS